MFYKVNDKYRLVGWKNLPTGILDMETKECTFLPREEYALLLHMNGLEEIHQDELDTEQQDIIRQLLERKLIEESSNPFQKTIDPLYQYFDNDYVGTVQWSITGKCNFNCRHCLLSSPENRAEDLTTEQCIDIVHQMAGCGIRKLSLTGGEPFVRKDLFKIIQACSDADIRITDIYTNGALLTSENIKRLQEMNQYPDIQISYDGVGWHDWVRGVNGAQKVAEKALITAYDAGLKTNASMCLFRDNIPAIRETVLLLASLHIDSIKISPMLDMGLWEKNYAEKTLTNKEFLEAVINYIPQFFEDGKPCTLRMGGYFDYLKDYDTCTAFSAKDPERSAPVYACRGFSTNLYIGSTGTAYPCMECAGNNRCEAFPNLTQKTFVQVLEDTNLLNLRQLTLEDIYAHNKECEQCPEKGKHCGESCRARAEYGFCGIERKTCDFVRNGWFRMIQKAVEDTGEKFEWC